MKKQELLAIAQAAAKNIKTQEDLNDLRQMLTKVTVEAALNAELDDHLGFDKDEQFESDNSRRSRTVDYHVGRFTRLDSATHEMPQLNVGRLLAVSVDCECEAQRPFTRG